MKIAAVQFYPWDKAYDFSIPVGPEWQDLAGGEEVIVQTSLGKELGRVTNIFEKTETEAAPATEIKPLLRRANNEDRRQLREKYKNREEVITQGKELVAKHNLPMKIVDVYFSFDGSRLTFTFVADGRVDFRELVKDLTRIFQKSIRLQQLGVRDEVKVSGDVGVCGRPLCCQKFLKELGNITSELADLQQIAHRGSERLSGACGRLLCCLAYEKPMYEKLAAALPPLQTKVRTDQGRGEVVAWHILKGTVDVRLEAKEGGTGAVVEIPVTAEAKKRDKKEHASFSSD